MSIDFISFLFNFKYKQPLHLALFIPSIRLQILKSLNGVFWNTLTPLETLTCHISSFSIFEKDL